MPPSRPVSSRRPVADPSEDMAANKHLVPKTIAEAKTRVRVTLQEVVGYILFTAILLAAGISTLVVYLSTYIVPYATFVEAECLVLNSTQSMLHEGFNREPLYRAEVYVYVFNTTNETAKCCCPDQFGRERCAEWEAIAYDNIREVHTVGDRTEWLRKYGAPGTFHPCWHSPGKEKVLLSRSTNSPFLMVPIVAFILGTLGLLTSTRKVQAFHQGRYIYMKLSGKFKESHEGGDEKEPGPPPRTPTPPSDEEGE
mmetsp:Transcript_12090/g.29565  ORF Transcript_12090/g.29565 Transcript_12090/m.29565 type:complete len:254 (+) Transcript_12090:108-869(+)